MIPIVRITAFIGRKPQYVSLDINSQSQHHSIYIIEITGNLVNFKNFAF
jgi:hypothetical protein